MAEVNRKVYTPELDGVRAPLGVILYLIRRDNLDIYDIPIARITKDYLDYLEHMESQEIELAGEFFVLAATLMRVKIQMLLRHDDDESEDPREGLVRSLLEYKKMAEAAKSMREMENERLAVYTHPVPELVKQYREEPEIDLSLYRLMRSFHEVIVHFEAADVREIELEEHTIEEKIEAVETALGSREQVDFHDLVDGATSRVELIVTLMAILELVKHGHIKVRQEDSFQAIWLYRGEKFGRPLDGSADWDDDSVHPVVRSDEQRSMEGDAHVE